MKKILAISAFAVCTVVLLAQRSAPAQLSGDDRILHALNRLTFGPRPGDLTAVRAIGLEAWIDRQLHPERIAIDATLAARVNGFVEPISPQRVDGLTKVAFQRSSQGNTSTSIAVPGAPQPGQALAQAKLLRAVESERQLEEVMADFWFNHFNVDAGKGAVWFTLTAYERDAIRPHVFGKFRDLLGATANSAAMMIYLDNAENHAGAINENYARELLELHTLGIDGGYTQRDIVEVARAFTGWTIDSRSSGGAFRYDAQLHDEREKTVLGLTLAPGGGRQDGEQVLDLLAAHPSTARFISRKLAQRFVADDPPSVLVERMTHVFLKSEGDIGAVLSAMFSSPEFFAPDVKNAKLKTPFETIVSAIRSTGAAVNDPAALARRAGVLGQPLYRKLEPTGYSTLEQDWMSSAGLLARLNFALDLTQNRIVGVTLGASSDEARQQAGLHLGSPEFQRK